MTDLARFDWNRLTANWEAWWRGELRRPMVHVRIEAPPGAVDAYPLHYMSMYDFSVPAEEILAVQEEYLKRCTYLADSYPSCWLNFGPGVLAAMIGGEGHNGENTVWFTPGRWENCDAAGIRPAFDPASPWFRRIEELCRAADRLWNGKIHLGCTDLGGALDVISSLLPGERLLYALYDSPDEIKRLTREIHTAWFEAFRRINALLPANRGYSAWDGMFSGKPFYMLQCDFCYMISPEMFAEFVLPELAESCRRLDRSFYHLDGKGELPHLPQLLSIPELGGIQWVPGAGETPYYEWIDVYRAVAGAGKRIWINIDGDFDSAARLIDAVGRPELFVVRGGIGPEREPELRDFLRRYSVPASE